MIKKNLSARKKPRQSRSQQTVDAILQAAAHILSSDQSGRFNTNYLAEVAGVSVGSIYQYFPNKESIVQGLITNYANSQGEIVTESLLGWAEGTSVEQLLTEVIEKIFNYRLKELKLNRAMATLVSGGELANEMDRWKDKLSKMITDLLFEMGYSSNKQRLEIKVQMVVNLCDYSMDHIIYHYQGGEEASFALSHLQKLILHSLAIDK